MVSLDHFGLTDAGKVRQNNEDALLSGEGRDPALFAVADGIGGFEAGEVASSMVVESLKSLDSGGSLPEAIQEANRRIYSAASTDEKLAGMGTTIVAVRLKDSGGTPEAEVSHVGDSRLYLLRGGEMHPLTEDHSLVAELVRSGSLTRAQASEHPQKNLITRALGAEEEVEVDSSSFEIHPGDRLILCSDGLPDMVPETRISSLVSGGGQDAEESARKLVSAALSAGGTDNVTVVVVDVDGRGSERGSTRPAASNREQDTGSPATGAAGTAFTAEPPGANGEDVEERSRRSARDGSSPETDAPQQRPRPGGRRSRGIFSRRRRSSGGRSRRSGGGAPPGARRHEEGKGPQRNGSQGQGSLIPGVWEGVREEEEPVPREPTPEEVVEQFRVRQPERERDERETTSRRRRKRLARGGRFVSTIVRGLAALALIAALLVPPYLWWSTRYYMAYDNEEIVIYQGVPYDFLGNELNRLDRRTGIMESDISEPYRDQVRDNRLYTEDRLQTVLDDLQEA